MTGNQHECDLNDQVTKHRGVLQAYVSKQRTDHILRSIKAINMSMARLFLVFLLSASSVAGNDPRAGSEHASLDFEVQGLVSWENAMAARAARTPDEFSPDAYSFRVVVKGAQWQIALLPVMVAPKETLMGKVPAKTSYLLSSDGTNVYEISRYRREELPDWQVEQFAEQWKGRLPMERGSHREAHALWYAFASSDYCGTMSGHAFMTLEPGDDSTVTGIMVRSEHCPRLPVHIVATNAANTHHWEFKVTGMTNHLGLALPLRGFLDAWVRPLPEPWSRVRFAVHQVLVPSTTVEFRPLLGNEVRSAVKDTTHRNDVVPFIARFQTNHWPDEEAVQASRPSQALPQSPVTTTNGARRGAARVAILVTLAGPVLAAAWYFAARQKRSKHEANQLERTRL